MLARRLWLLCVVAWFAAALAGAVTAAEAEDDVGTLGPPLTALPDKIASGDWLVAFLQKPSQVKPGTTMPDFDIPVGDAQAMARFLYAGTAAASGRAPAGDATRGKELFVDRGCRGCHAITPGEASISTRVPNLAGIGLKVRADWLARWLRSPRDYHRETAMPKLPLSDADVGDLVAYLMQRREGAADLAGGPRFAANAERARGRALLKDLECAKCHAIDGFPPPARGYTLATPAAGEPDREAVLEDGRKLVAYYNCHGCHRIDGSGGAIAQHLARATLAPPSLEGEGARVQPSWLVGFLERPTALRPWLSMRMPDYGLSTPEAAVLARYFATLADLGNADEAVPSAEATVVNRGLQRFAGLQCLQCHAANADGKPPPGVDPADLAIDLGLAKKRLRPSWIPRFLADPKAIAGEQSRMPAVFYTADGAPKVDDPTADVAAITAFLLHVDGSPQTAVAAHKAERATDPKQAPTDWSTYRY